MLKAVGRDECGIAAQSAQMQLHEAGIVIHAETEIAGGRAERGELIAGGVRIARCPVTVQPLVSPRLSGIGG